MTDYVDRLPQGVREIVDSSERLNALAALDAIGQEPDRDFDRLSKLTARAFGTELALVSVFDNARQWFSGCFGTGTLREASTDTSFCAHAIALPRHDDVLVVLDTAEDERFRDSPLVLGGPQIRFYVGMAVVVGGQKIGSVCALSSTPRTAVDPEQIDQLRDLAGLAGSLFALKDEARVRARTAAALLREEWRHALTLEAGKVGSWVWDVRSGEVVCNDTFRRMYELPEVGPIHFDRVVAATHEDDRAAVQAGIEATLNEGVDYSAESRVGSKGRWLTMRGRVYQRDATGKPLVMMGASIDISEAKQSAVQTRLLLRELNHRVKNTLAMIQSVARQTARQNPDPRDFMAMFSGRLRTISETHVLLADRDWSGVQLYDVIGTQLGQDFISKPNRADVEGPDLELPADHALGLGLILHELTTNANHHGAWSNEKGTVSLRWKLVDQPTRGLSLRWREQGGPAVVKPSEYGLGAKLIERSLAKVLDSKVDLSFPPEGVTVDIWLPLPAA